MKKEHILIIRFSALGDVAMLVPVVASLAQQYPDIRITVLSRPFARPLFEGLAPNVGFMGADIKNEYHGVRGLNTLYRRLTAKQFTAVADMHNVLRSNFLRLRFNLGHYKVDHINKHRRGKRQLTSYRNRKLIQQPTSFQNYADVLERIGYPVTLDTSWKLDLSKVPELYARNGAPLSSFLSTLNIGIAPFAAHQGKIYPLQHMERVMELLTERHPDAKFFLFGGGSKEVAVINEWCSKYKQCVSVPSLLKGIDKEVTLMSHLNVMISMDSANMHFASLVATPVVSIWGATHPYAGFMGWGQDAANVVQLDMDCRPCSIFGNKPCRRGDFACMMNISPEHVVQKVESILTQNKK